jgi:CheY-like chemotaxis protein
MNEPTNEIDKKRYKILLAEDNLINQKLAVDLLKKIGYQAICVLNGIEAVEAMKKDNYHLILMDIQMPFLDGLEATRIIRENEKISGTNRVPIVAMTAYAMYGDKERFLKSDIDDYIAKPIKVDEFFKIVDKYLKGCNSNS